MDKIIMKNLSFFGRHGVFEEERVYGQKFIVDAILHIDLQKAGASDDLSNTVSYSEIYEIIKDIVENEKFQLIEALAENICSKVLGYNEKIETIELTVKKPDAPVDGDFDFFGVRIKRNNKNHIHVENVGATQNSGIYLSLGSNLGDREDNLNIALERMGEHVNIIKRSSFYETKPVDYELQDNFLNMVAEVETNLPPHQLLEFLQRIEKDMGREKTIRFGPRNIDIDILLYENVRHETTTLTIPHPRMMERGFVLIPLKEIAPLLHIDGHSIDIMIQNLKTNKDVDWSDQRINNIMKDNAFLNFMSYNEKHEIDREFCRHDFSHLMDVCREAWIMNLEENLGFSKDVVYAAGLLHDIGRWMEYEMNRDHAEASAELAIDILTQVKFLETETKQIIDAIANHRENKLSDDLSRIIYNADKRSRLCLLCEVRYKCKRFITAK